MLELKRKSLSLNIFGAYLIVAGVIGFLSNPEKAKTALYSGGIFGTLLLICGVLLAYQKAWAAKVGLGLCAFLALTFAWRASVGWIAVSNGQNEKLFAAGLISTMLLGALVTLRSLLKKPKALQT